MQKNKKMPDDKIKIADINKILKSLDERKYKIIRWRYWDGHIREDIAVFLSISVERVRQIEVAIQDRLMFLVEGEKTKDETVPIELLNLKIRGFLALKREGIDTVDKLIKLSYQDLLNIKGIGIDAGEDIKLKLENFMKTNHVEHNLIRSLSIDVFNFSNRTSNVLKREGIYMVGQLLLLSEQEIYRMRGIGKKCISEILQKREKLEKEVYNDKYKNNGLTIDMLGLSYRGMRCIKEIGIKTIGEFIGLTKKEVLSVWYVGTGTWQEIYEKQQSLK